ncbi:MAG TPA: hypothetical protein VKB88_34955 [Bryobacteraceae bacterium]|nr:hypothetical protein [Bryobacteraceae bacterium]
MVRTTGSLAITLMLAGTVAPVNAAELQQSTAGAWQAYVREADTRMQARLETGKPFLWMDEAANRSKRVRNGEIVVAPLVGRGTETVPNGLIHDWIGAAFIPNASIESVLGVVRDYDRYKDIFKPVVTDSRSLNTGMSDQEFSMVWQKHVLFVNAAMRGRYRAHDVMIDSHRGYSTVDTVTLQEIEDYGRPGEHILPPDTGAGLIWRIHSISRYEERDGGVYLEIEAIALSRDIPSSLRWLVSPVVNHLSVKSLMVTLQQTREAVDSQRVALERLVATERKGLN